MRCGLCNSSYDVRLVKNDNGETPLCGIHRPNPVISGDTIHADHGSGKAWCGLAAKEVDGKYQTADGCKLSGSWTDTTCIQCLQSGVKAYPGGDGPPSTRLKELGVNP